ncbi:polysaccharide pyruvyl transferase family protein [Microbacterium profundi]
MLAALRPTVHPDLEPWRGRKKVVLALAGFYQNLGDMALTYAQKRFIEQTLPDYEVLLFPSTATYGQMKALKRVVGPDDIITTIGGGNMDDIYPSLENARRFIVRSFPKHPIVSFPQTMAFSDTPGGRRALRRSARTYRAHLRLTVFAREPESFERMKSSMGGVRAECTPDSVLSVTYEDSDRERAGILVSLRSDKEGVLSKRNHEDLFRLLGRKSDDILMRDTVDIPLADCQPSTYEQTLWGVWDLVSSRRIMVTDRLHGMIFAVLTRTPVVVLSNSNHKIRGTYEAWLKDDSLVRYIDSFDEAALTQAIDELWELPQENVGGPDLSPRFEPLRKALLSAAGRSEEASASEDSSLDEVFD